MKVLLVTILMLKLQLHNESHEVQQHNVLPFSTTKNNAIQSREPTLNQNVESESKLFEVEGVAFKSVQKG